MGERRSSGRSEACRIRRAEGSGACDDEVEETQAELYRTQVEGMKVEREDRAEKTKEEAK